MTVTNVLEVQFVNCAFDKTDPVKSSRELARFLFPELGRHELGEADLEVKALSQGTTNGLFKVSLRASDGVSALVKVYGDGTEITIDRNKELKVHKLLSGKNLSSSPLVRFVNGHAYQFIPGVVCSERDISQPRIWRGVARELARWHATLPVVKPSRDDPQEDFHLEPSIWSTARKWLEAVPSKPRRSTADKDQLVEAFEYLTRKLLAGGKPSGPLVLGHGDLLCGNIIVQDLQAANGANPPGTASVRFIDYEHATYCPRAFELANHFSEWAGFECDYGMLPTKATRRGFIREYLQAHGNLMLSPHLQAGADEPTPALEQQGVTEADVDELMDQVDAFRGFPGFYWGLCALIQAEASTGTIDFDYSGYAEKRLAEYWSWRRAEDGKVEDGDSHCHEEALLREKKWASP